MLRCLGHLPHLKQACSIFPVCKKSKWMQHRLLGRQHLLAQSPPSSACCAVGSTGGAAHVVSGVSLHCSRELFFTFYYVAGNCSCAEGTWLAVLLERSQCSCGSARQWGQTPRLFTARVEKCLWVPSSVEGQLPASCPVWKQPQVQTDCICLPWPQLQQWHWSGCCVWGFPPHRVLPRPQQCLWPGHHPWQGTAQHGTAGSRPMGREKETARPRSSRIYGPWGSRSIALASPKISRCSYYTAGRRCNLLQPCTDGAARGDSRCAGAGLPSKEAAITSGWSTMREAAKPGLVLLLAFRVKRIRGNICDFSEAVHDWRLGGVRSFVRV